MSSLIDNSDNNNIRKVGVSDMSMYNTKTFQLEDILKDESYKNDDNNNIRLLYWYPNQELIKRLESHLFRKNITDKIVDAGCGNNPFSPSTHILDIKDIKDINERTTINFDLNFDKFEKDNMFNFVYCRHTLEDLQNPQNAFNEFIKVSPKGYIETPSPLIEFSRGVDADIEWVNSSCYRGYRHHRYIVWSDLNTNTLYFLPKYPIIEYCKVSDNTNRLLNYIANNYPLYWNNYYYWDVNNKETQPKICVLNNISFGDYNKYLTEAINKSIEYTKHFMENTV